MKKYFPVIVALLFMVLFFSPKAVAAEVEWRLIWHDDGRIEEQITAEGQNIEVDETWKYEQDHEKSIITREVENWHIYNSLPDRLPVQAQVKDFLIFKTISLNKNQVTSGSLYPRIIDDYSGKLYIHLPGIIRESSAVDFNDLTGIWNLSQIDNVAKEDYIMKAVTFEGLPIAILIFVLGALIIMAKFIGKMRKVNQLIEEEYSLDRVQEIEIEDE